MNYNYKILFILEKDNSKMHYFQPYKTINENINITFNCVKKIPNKGYIKFEYSYNGTPEQIQSQALNDGFACLILNKTERLTF